MNFVNDFSNTNINSNLPKFLITDVNSSYNKGDAAIVLGILKIIRKLYPLAQITVMTPTPNEDAKYYSKYGAATHTQLYNYFGRNTTKFFYMFFFLFKMSYYLIWTKFKFLPIPRTNKITLKLYQQSNLIISCSGGRLGGKKISPIFNSLIPIYFAKKMGKKVFVCAQSIEPFKNKIVKKLTRLVLNTVNLITVREEFSYEVVKSLNMKTPCHLTADLAFLLDSDSLETGKLLLIKEGVPMNNKLKIGITVTEWRIPDSNSELKNIQFIKTIIDILERLLKEKKPILIFFPQVIIPKKEDDRLLSNEIKNQIDSSLRENVFILRKNYSPHQLKAMMGNMDIFIGKRLHSCIFALAMHVPSIIIGYEKKAWGIMKMLGYQDFVVNVNSLNVQSVIETITKILNDKDQISKNLKEKIPIIQKYSMKNGDFVPQLLNEKETME